MVETKSPKKGWGSVGMDVSKDVHASGMISLNSMDSMRESKIEFRAGGASDRSKQANEVAREYVSPRLSPRLIQ